MHPAAALRFADLGADANTLGLLWRVHSVTTWTLNRAKGCALSPVRRDGKIGGWRLAAGPVAEAGSRRSGRPRALSATLRRLFAREEPRPAKECRTGL
ncbi:hypothetical protein GCM10010441_37620 [Kitasatospora paracochleata]